MLTTAAAIVGVAALLIGLRLARGPDCATVERALVGIWDAPRRQAIRAAFLSRQLPRALQAWERVSTALDAYAADWVVRRRTACMNPGKGDAARGLVAEQVACLDRCLTELRVLSELLSNSEVDATEHGPQAVMELRSPDRCEREAAALTNLSLDEEGLLERLAQVHLLTIVGRYKEALDLARALLPASEHAHPAIRAKALLRSGRLELRRSLDVGVAQLRQAALLAEKAREDETRAEALIHLTFAMSQQTSPSDLALGEQYAEQAAAVVERLGGDRHLDPMVFAFRGLLLAASERYDEAVAQLERALALLERDPARDRREYNRVLTVLGTTLVEMGRPEDGLLHLKRALALTEGSMGAQSPTLAIPVFYVGAALFRAGRASEATPYLERALSMLVDDANSRASAFVALTLGMCRAEQGDTTGARPLLERALAISIGLASGDNLQFEVPLALGQHLAKNGDAPRGRALLEQALQRATGLESTAKARFALAQALPRAQRNRAHELARQARETYVRAGERRGKEVAAIDAWLASFQSRSR